MIGAMCFLLQISYWAFVAMCWLVSPPWWANIPNAIHIPLLCVFVFGGLISVLLANSYDQFSSAKIGDGDIYSAETSLMRCWIKRADKITGPFPPAETIRMRRAKQFKKSDTIGFSNDGPFKPIAKVFNIIIKEDRNP